MEGYAAGEPGATPEARLTSTAMPLALIEISDGSPSSVALPSFEVMAR